MQVERVVPLSYYHSSIIFKTEKVCADVPQESKEAEPMAATSLCSRGALSQRLHRKHAVGAHRAERVQRSRSSPERNYSSNAPGAVAFYSPGPPSRPMYLVLHSPNPMAFTDGAKTFQPTKLQAITNVTKSKKSRKIVRHVMLAILRGVDKAVIARALPAPAVSAAEDTSTAKANPVFHSVASQTKPKSPIIRQAVAVTDADGLSNSSGECCVESEDACEWAGNVRALRDSHVRLVLRQLQQLHDIERLKRTLLRAHIASPQAQTVHVPLPASCVSQIE